MIPGKIVRFLQQYANVGFAGTRDRDLVPHGHCVTGWQVGADARTMRVFVPEQFTPGLVDSLQDNGEIAVVVEEFPSHETYQFKGRYLGHRAVVPEELEIVGHVRRRFVKSLRPVFANAPESVLQAFVLDPALSVEFEVHEIYLQTPGPGAGTRLIPPAER